MSLEVTCKTQITNRDSLIEILNDILGKGSAQVAEVGTKVTGYYSNKNIEVTINNIKGMYGTAGYYKNKNGSYELVYDSMDAKRLSKIIPRKIGTSTVDPVSQANARRKVMATIRGLRGRLSGDTVEQDGTIRLKVKVTQY